MVPAGCGRPPGGRRRRWAWLPCLVLPLALNCCQSGPPTATTTHKRVIVLGIDGMDPVLLAQFVEDGRMPNFGRFMDEDHFRPLRTSTPPQSPVAWSSFITGMNPGGHGIFDFIHRDPATLSPYLSTSRSEEGAYALSMGSWRVPLSAGRVTLLRRGKAFWEILGGHGIPAAILRAPANFPPAGESGHQLSGMGTPDLQGTYGTFSFYTEDPDLPSGEVSGGKVIPLTVRNQSFQARIAGPPNPFRTDVEQAWAPFQGTVDPESRVVRIELGDRRFLLQEGIWSQWIEVEFELVPLLHSVRGICRFYLKQAAPRLQIYVTPVNIHPSHPALPISHPADYSHELCEQIGLYSTLGIPEDTKALSSGILDEEEFLQQADSVFEEELRMLETGLRDFREGLFFFYLGRLDQLSHMFWSAMDPRHPGFQPDSPHAATIPDTYLEMDRVLGRVLEEVDDRTTLLVMSDHGFAPFYRAFHLNTWLRQQGYITVLQGSEEGMLRNVDWSRTRAYGFGFNGLYLNLYGREPRGIVRRGAEEEALLQEIASRLLELRDPESGEAVLARVHRPDSIYSGPRRREGPDLVLGYHRGYRASWETTLGRFPETVLEDNLDKWSGDHLIHADAVPGILISNRKIRLEKPGLTDLAPTILAEFGLPPEPAMVGQPLF